MRTPGTNLLDGRKEMGDHSESIENIVKKLPPEYQEEVRNFVEALMEKRLKRLRGTPKFDWGGTHKELRDPYTSVELQHKVPEWRIGGQ
jgi:hypothetical protein